MAGLARLAVLQALRGCRTPAMEIFQQQTRKMGGGGGGAPWHFSYNGKPVPVELRGPAYITYGGLTLPKRVHDYDYWATKVLGATFWFTMFYHAYLNWDEHVYGDIWVFERDVQLNGWGDDDAHGHSHGKSHGHGKAHSKGGKDHGEEEDAHDEGDH